MTSSNANIPKNPEASDADRQWQSRPLQDSPSEDLSDDLPAERPAEWEASEADLQEQRQAVNPDDEDDYPHGERS